MSDAQVTFELCGHFRCYSSFIRNKTTFTRYCLTQCISKLRKSFEIHWVGLYLTNFTDLACIANITVYKTESVFTGLGHGNLSQFLTLLMMCLFFCFVFLSSKSIPWQWGKASGAIQKDIGIKIWYQAWQGHLANHSKTISQLVGYITGSRSTLHDCIHTSCGLCTAVRCEIVSLFYTGVGDI